MKTPDYRKSYLKQVKDLKSSMDEAEALTQAIGGNFSAGGQLEFYLLQLLGLQPNDTVIDVGCGNGRLAFHLKDYLQGRYVGMDVVPDLFQYAEKICERPDWSFYEAPGLSIPEEDNSADFICYFSVITHLLHTESYQYLADAARVLKPGGKLVVSFLEFMVPSHWAVFEASLAQGPDAVLNQFVSRDALEHWAAHIGLEIILLYKGDTPHIPIPEGHKVRWDDGVEMEGLGTLGHSICVMTKNA